MQRKSTPRDGAAPLRLCLERNQTRLSVEGSLSCLCYSFCSNCRCRRWLPYPFTIRAGLLVFARVLTKGAPRRTLRTAGQVAQPEAHLTAAFPVKSMIRMTCLWVNHNDGRKLHLSYCQMSPPLDFIIWNTSRAF